jgi:outer membrane protein TolC
MATRNDVLKLEVQEADIKFRQADAANGAALAAIALNNVLGIHLATNIELTENPKEKSDSYASLDQMVLSSFNLRPDLKAAGLRVQASESGIEIANSAWYPQISLIGNYTFAQPNQRIFPTKNQFFGTWDLSLGLSFDIWDWNSRFYQTQQAEAQRIQAREAVNVIKDGVSLEITSNFLTMNQAGEKIKIAGFAKQQAEENYRIYGERFKQGLALSSELIDAEAAYLQAKTNFTTSVVDYEIALAKLQKSIGESNQ